MRRVQHAMRAHYDACRYAAIRAYALYTLSRSATRRPRCRYLLCASRRDVNMGWNHGCLNGYACSHGTEQSLETYGDGVDADARVHAVQDY